MRLFKRREWRQKSPLPPLRITLLKCHRPHLGVSGCGGGKDMAEVCGAPCSPRSPDSDCNSNPTGVQNDHFATSCLSNVSHDMDFVQDNSDYQWFLDYGYREGGTHHHTSVLSLLSASYTGPEELGYYDAMSKNLDANLAEADMESFRTEDIHSLLTTLPAICTDMQIIQENNREGEMYASISGSLMDKFDLDSSISPHTSSQGEESAGSIDTMSICKSELLFSPVKEVPMPGHNYSVDSLDCELPNEQDIMLTCQANKNNYTIAFEGSVTCCSEASEDHNSDKSEATTSSSQNWSAQKTVKSVEKKHFKLALDNSMAKSDSGFTTWSKLKKRTSEMQLRRHPSGNNNTTTESNESYHLTNNHSVKSQSMPNLNKKQKQKYFCHSIEKNNGLSNSSIESCSNIQRFPVGCIKVFDIQHQTTSGSVFSDIASSIDGGDSSCSDRCQAKIEAPNFNLVKRFMKQKSISADGMSSVMDRSSASECCHSGTSTGSFEDRQRNNKLSNSVTDNNKYHCDNRKLQGHHQVNNWITAEEADTENSTSLFEDSLVEPKTVNIVYRTHDLIREESEERLSDKLESDNNVRYDNDNKLRKTRTLFNVNNNNSIDRGELASDIEQKSSAESASISMYSSSEATEATKIPRYSSLKNRTSHLPPALKAIDRSIQTSLYGTLSKSKTNNIKIIEPSFLNKLKKDSSEKPVYVVYPNYTLPNLDFLNENQTDAAKLLLLPQKFTPTFNKISSQMNEKHSSKSRRPFSCNDMEMLKRKGFGHVKDWESLTFLLPREYRQILAAVPEVVQEMKLNEEDLLKQKEEPMFCTTRQKTRPQSCDLTGMVDRTTVSSSSSTATQPSSGYRGSSTMLLTDSVQNSPAPANNYNPLFIYRYDSVTSSEASLLMSEKQRSQTTAPPLPKRSISLPNSEQKPIPILRKAESIPPRPPLPKGILRKSLELSKKNKNSTNKRYSMFEMGDTDEVDGVVGGTKRKSLHDPYYISQLKNTEDTDESYADEGVDAGTDSSMETNDRYTLRPPTPPLPKTNDSVFVFPSINNVSQDELLQLEDFLKQSGISCSDSDEWSDSDMLNLRSQVSRFLALKINQNPLGRKTVSFSDKISVRSVEEEAMIKQATPTSRQFMGLAELPICEESEASPEERISPPLSKTNSTDLGQKSALICAVNEAIEQILQHFSPANDKKELIVLGNSSETPSCARLILSSLCPALYAVLSDGLKPNLETTFGAINNSVWQVVEAAAQNGPLTKSLNELVMRINGEDVITEGLIKFNAFILGLLNVQSVDAWFSYLRTRESILRKHYNTDSLLLMAHTGSAAIRNLMDTLINSLQSLAMLPFQIDLMFEYRQLHMSMKRMEALQQPSSPTHFRLSPTKPSISSKQWALMKLVRSIQSSASYSLEEDIQISSRSKDKSINSDSPLPDLVGSSSSHKKAIREEKQRPRSYVEKTTTEPSTNITDITTTVKKRWSGVHLGSKLYQAFDRLATEDTEEEYSDSLEPIINNILHMSPQKKSLASDETSASEITNNSASEGKEPALNGGKFRRLQMKWEMLSGKDSSISPSTSPTDSPIQTPESTSSGKSRIPRLIPSPIKSPGSSIPVLKTARKTSNIPLSMTPKRQATESKLPVTNVRKSTTASPTSRTSRVDQHETANENKTPRPHLVRPSSLPYRTPQQTNKNSKLTPPRRAVSSSVHRTDRTSKTTPAKSTPKFVRTLSHRLPSDNGHLSFNEGEKLKVVLEVDNKWLLCCRGEQKGLVPRSAVITLSVDMGQRF